MNHSFIYHIVTPAQWENFADKSFYEATSLIDEGFIHTSLIEQVAATLKRYYKNELLVLLLKIETSKLKAALKYELAPSVNQYFPHIYGALNKDAIVSVTELVRGDDGLFTEKSNL